MAFLGLIIFLLIIFIQPQEFLPGMKGVQIVAIVMGIVALFWLPQRLIKKGIKIKSQQSALMVLFWILIVLSTLNIGWLGGTFTTIIEWGKFVLIYFIMIDLINSPAKFETTMFTLITGGVVIAVFGVLQWFGIDITGIGFSSDTMSVRIRGIGIFDTNQLAYTMCFLAPLVFYFLSVTKNLIIKLFFAAVFCLFYYTVYLTSSRGGMICAVMVVGLLFVLYNKKKSAQTFGLALATVLFLSFLALSSRLQTVSGYKQDGSAKGRTDAWGAALINLKSYPLGIGKEQFQDYFHIAAHNSYIQVISEIGIFGLFVWLALFYYSIKNLRLISKYSEPGGKNKQANAAKSLQVSLFAYLIGSFFSNSGYYITLYILFALIVSLQRLSNPDIFKENRLFEFKDLMKIGTLEIMIILLIHITSI